MARSSVCSLLAAFVVASWVTACVSKKAGGPDEPEGDSRADIEMDMRARLARVDGDACTRETWLKAALPKATGLEAEVAEELLVEQAAGCRKVKQEKAGPAPAAVAGGEPGAPGAAKPDPATAAKPDPATAARPDPATAAKPDPAGPRTPPPDPIVGSCTRKRAEADLRASTGRQPMRNQIDAEFQRCFNARIADCQLALDADIDEGIACWKQAPWPEVPASVPPEDVANTSICLVELKGVIADLRKCRSKKAADLDACAGPYIGYSPQCPLLKAERVWRLFPGREDVERVALARRDPKAAKEKAEQEAKEAKLKAEQAKLKAEQDKKAAEEARLKAEKDAKEAKLKAEQEAKLKAEQEKKAAEDAKIAKETERCFGRTTIEFAEKLKAQPGPRTVPGCKYQVMGRVISKNNVFVQLSDPSGALIVLLRTKEAFKDGDTVSDRIGTFDSIEEAEMADGSKKSYAVFALEPAPPPKK